MIRYVLYAILVLSVWLVFNHWMDWRALLYSIAGVFIAGFIAQRWGYALLVQTYKLINRFIFWAKLPTLLAVLNLDIFRIELRKKNLFDTPKNTKLPPAEWSPEALNSRSADGSFNDLNDPDMGRAGEHFGRNFELKHCYPDPELLMKPNPRDISKKLMVRKEFVPATTLNLLTAAWIQFQVHGWVNHERSANDFHEIPLTEDDDWPQSQRPMRVANTKVGTKASDHFPPAFVNTESHWWDQSQLYGITIDAQLSLRTQQQGKLKIEEHTVDESIDHRLEPNPVPGLENIDHTGFFDNYWSGLSIFHTIFTLEHNAICDRLITEYPHWNDQQLFATARLINCALIAKIHTVDWTPAILGHPALEVSMNANWWGLLGENIRKNQGRVSKSEELSGILGSETEHYTAAYSLTEEFTAVYRLHPLIPDTIATYSCQTGDLLFEKSFTEVQGKFTRPSMENVRIADLFYSFGIVHPGAITLHNYPDTLRNFERINPDIPAIDLAAVDILRDRERGVPRYNQFRKLLHKKPVSKFSEITSNKEWAKQIEELYEGNIDLVDTMVGLLAEDLPKGFGFSDTAFRVFILMASRRLKSDRFFTKDYTAEVYTQLGLNWIDDHNMSSVIIRHYPELTPAIQNISNVFAPWDDINQWQPIPK
ncbi:Peroxidase [hydrothermal vent metagenome]|uniref:Peroxidase n=1 Tax=hydrothermal vent metagenome TaxID=652676 RepID=A0A3B0ZC20_9ZZZZ